MAIAAILVVLGVGMVRNMRGQVQESGHALVQETVQRRLNLTCQSILDGAEGEAIAYTMRDSQTQVVAINAEYMNKLAADCNVACMADLMQYDTLTLSIPRGALTGSAYLADKGRPLNWQMHVSYEVSTRYFSQCMSVGINQIRYAVYLQIDANAIVTIPSIIQNVQYTYYVPVCEMMYHADVPNVYVADENGTEYLDLLP